NLGFCCIVGAEGYRLIKKLLHLLSLELVFTRQEEKVVGLEKSMKQGEGIVILLNCLLWTLPVIAPFLLRGI
ncbi:hypothetical protein S245_017411, partial [Arachis hypogaea]